MRFSLLLFLTWLKTFQVSNFISGEVEFDPNISVGTLQQRNEIDDIA